MKNIFLLHFLFLIVRINVLSQCSELIEPDDAYGTGTSRSGKHEPGEIKVGAANTYLYTYRGWVRFDLDDLGEYVYYDNVFVDIDDIELNIFVNNASRSQYHGIDVTKMTVDPGPGTNSNTIYNDIGAHYDYISDWKAGTSYGGHSISLGNNAENELQIAVNNLDFNWLIGLKENADAFNRCVIDGNGNERPPYIVVKFYKIPTSPTGVNASDGTYCDGVQITWNSVAGATFYTVKKGSATVCNTPNTYCYDYSASSSSTQYRVYSNSECGTSSSYGSDNGYRRSLPTAPPGVSASDQTYCDKVEIIWSSVSGATSYDVYRNSTYLGNTSSTSYEDNSAPTSSTQYRVYSNSECGVSSSYGSDQGYQASQPDTTIVSGSGSFCDNSTLTASGGSGGTIYFQGTTSNGTSITVPATLETVSASGTYYFRSRSSAGCWGVQGSASVTISSSIESSVRISASPGNNINQGDLVIFIANNVNEIPSPSYQWKLNDNNIGINSPTFSSSTLQNGDQIECAISSSSSCVIGSPAASNKITITVKPDGPNPSAPIFPSTDTCQFAGDEFWVDIHVGTETDSVIDLLGVSFELDYNQTDYIDVVNHMVGPFLDLGENPLLPPVVDVDTGKVSIGITRLANQGGVSGKGVVYRVKFDSKQNTPDNTQINFSLSNVEVWNSTGEPIPLDPSDFTVTIKSGITVWPGDTDNDGKVDQGDILPIGLYWHNTGPKRVELGCRWAGLVVTPWDPEKSTYADADGDSIVDQAEIRCIAANWGNMHNANSLARSTSAQLNPLSPNLIVDMVGKTNPGDTFWAEFQVDDVTDLFGIAFEFTYPSNMLITPVSVESGSFMGDDVIFLANEGMEPGRIGIGISRKAGQGGINGSGTVARVQMHISEIATVNDTLKLKLREIKANDSAGNAIEFGGKDKTITDVEEVRPAHIRHDEFGLNQNYPNPFNRETYINFHLLSATQAKIEIFNLQGQQIALLIDEERPAGLHTTTWNGRKDSGEKVAAGVYIYRLTTERFQQSRRLVLMP